LALGNDEKPVSIEPGSRTAYYIVNALPGSTTEGGSRGSFVLRPQTGLDASVFSVYSSAGNENRITTIVTVIGQSSGIRRDFVVNIDRN
jgi:hypothetical protein